MLCQIQRPLQGAALILDFFLQEGDGVKQLLRPGRAPRHVHVNGNHLIHSLHQSVVVEDSA